MRGLVIFGVQNNLEERALESAVPGRGNSAAVSTAAVFAIAIAAAAAQGKVAVLASMISAHSPEEKNSCQGKILQMFAKIIFSL